MPRWETGGVFRCAPWSRRVWQILSRFRFLLGILALTFLGFAGGIAIGVATGSGIYEALEIALIGGLVGLVLGVVASDSPRRRRAHSPSLPLDPKQQYRNNVRLARRAIVTAGGVVGICVSLALMNIFPLGGVIRGAITGAVGAGVGMLLGRCTAAIVLKDG
jgi:hypothetical protein